MLRTQIFGDAGRMGNDAEIERELQEAEAAEAAGAEEEKEARAQEEAAKKYARRGRKNLQKFA